MAVVLIVILLCIFFFWRKRNLASKVLIIMSLLSLLSGFIVDYSMPFSGIKSLVVISLMVLYIYLLFKPIALFPSTIRIEDSHIRAPGFKNYSKLMTTIGLFSMAIYLPIYFVVSNMDIDINQFKYDGGFEYFVYSGAFPIPVKIYIIVSYLGELSILLLPLHFTYLQIGDKKNAILTFIGSLTYLFKGLIFFSRATPVIYVLLYFFLLLLFQKSLPKNLINKIKIFFITGGVVLSLGFISTSNKRFDDGTISGVAAKHTGDMFKYLDNPTAISYFDYFGQGYYNSYNLLSLYNGRTFNTQVTFHDIYVLLNQYLGFPFSELDYMNRRQSLWKDPYWYTFNTYTCYVIYDFGIIISFLLTFYVYRKMKSVAKCSSIGRSLSFSQLTSVTFYLLIVTTSIFFSSLASCIIPYFFFYVCYNLFTTTNFYKHRD